MMVDRKKIHVIPLVESDLLHRFVHRDDTGCTKEWFLGVFEAAHWFLLMAAEVKDFNAWANEFGIDVSDRPRLKHLGNQYPYAEDRPGDIDDLQQRVWLFVYQVTRSHAQRFWFYLFETMDAGRL